MVLAPRSLKLLQCLSILLGGRCLAIRPPRCSLIVTYGMCNSLLFILIRLVHTTPLIHPVSFLRNVYWLSYISITPP